MSSESGPSARFAGFRTSRLAPAVRGVLHALVSWIPLTLAIGASPALFLWPLLHPEHASYIADNDLRPGLRLSIGDWLSASLGLTLGFYLAYWLSLRRRNPVGIGAAFRRLNRYTSVVLALPFVPLLRLEKIETERPVLTLCVCLAVGLIAAHFAYRVWRPELGWLAPRLSARATRGLALGGAIVLAGAYAYQMSSLHLLHHRNLGTSIYDLGLYANVFWQSIHGNPLGCSFMKSGSHVEAHFSPILLLLSPLYLLAPRAETLLVLQSTWLASAVIPLYLISVHRTRRAWMGLLLSAVYLLYPALHGANMYDFHSVTLCVPILMWAIYLLETGRLGWYWPVLLLLLLTREDMGLLGCLLGLYAVLERRFSGLGVTTIVVSLLYLAAVKIFAMKGGGNYAYYFSDLDARGARGVASIVWSLVTNPVFALGHILSLKKVLYALKLLLPLLLAPLFSGKMCLMLVYGFGITLLATRSAVYSLAFQYSVLIFPFLFAATPKGLERISHSRLARALDLRPAPLRVALGTGMLVCCLLISESYGVFWQNHAFRAGFTKFNRESTETEKRRYALVRNIAALIPPDAAVAASEKLGAHFANRDQAFKFPRVTDSEYVVYWTRDLKKKKDRAGLAKFRKARAHKTVVKRHGIRLYRRVYRE